MDNEIEPENTNLINSHKKFVYKYPASLENLTLKYDRKIIEKI